MKSKSLGSMLFSLLILLQTGIYSIAAAEEDIIRPGERLGGGGEDWWARSEGSAPANMYVPPPAEPAAPLVGEAEAEFVPPEGTLGAEAMEPPPAFDEPAVFPGEAPGVPQEQGMSPSEAFDEPSPLPEEGEGLAVPEGEGMEAMPPMGGEAPMEEPMLPPENFRSRRSAPMGAEELAPEDSYAPHKRARSKRIGPRAQGQKKGILFQAPRTLPDPQGSEADGATQSGEEGGERLRISGSARPTGFVVWRAGSAPEKEYAPLPSRAGRGLWT